ncbi:MAG: hypothetical protein V4574_13355 [Pseudomonadota bacterium]
MKRLGSIGATMGALLLAGCNPNPAPLGNGTGNETGNTAEPVKTADINPVVDNCNTTLPPSPAVVTPEMARSGLPCSLAFDGTFAIEPVQEAFDFNSWLTFAALNAPEAGGTAGADAPTNWEAWQDLYSLMLPGGATPPPFGSSVPPPAICKGGTADTAVMRMISKTPVTPTLQVAGQPLNTGPLIDQNGHYVRYQILVNKPMYDYIVANNLYSKAGQQAFTGDISFPEGATVDKTTKGTIGAIVVKAAWKVLDPADPNDAAANFHVTKAYVYTAAAPGVKESCVTETLGLVGLHIVHKTTAEPQWIWSTFEHVRNVPNAFGPAASGNYNFYKAGCSTTACKVNVAPPQPWNPSVDPFPGDYHSQIVRKTKYPGPAVRSAALWNGQFRPALGGVWQNYELITTQWPTDAKNKVDPDGAPFPVFAANATMETYVQNNVPLAGSSCMGCHGNATGMTGKPSDFSFVLEKAN